MLGYESEVIKVLGLTVLTSACRALLMKSYFYLGFSDPFVTTILLLFANALALPAYFTSAYFGRLGEKEASKQRLEEEEEPTEDVSVNDEVDSASHTVQVKEVSEDTNDTDTDESSSITPFRTVEGGRKHLHAQGVDPVLAKTGSCRNLHKVLSSRCLSVHKLDLSDDEMDADDEKEIDAREEVVTKTAREINAQAGNARSLRRNTSSRSLGRHGTNSPGTSARDLTR